MTSPVAVPAAPGAALDGVRVLVAGAAWPPEPFIIDLFERMTARGAEVRFVEASGLSGSFDDFPPRRHLARARAEVSNMRVRVRTRAAANRGEDPDAVAVTDLASHLEREVRRRRPHVVYFPWIANAIGVIDRLNGLCPVLVSCRGSQVNVGPWEPGRESMRDGLRTVFAAAAATHCVSDAIRQESVALGLDPARSRVIRPGTDADYFGPPTVPRHPGQPFRLMSVGALRWVKGYDTAVLALARLRDAGLDVVLDLVGEGSEADALRGLAREMGVADRVRLLGHRDRPQIRDALRAADAFLLSSVSEGISNAALEAMATELPVVTTDCGGMTEVVTDGADGLVVPRRDDRAIAAAVARLVADPDLAGRLGRAGRQRVLDGFTAERTANEFSELLADLTRQGVA